MRSDQPPRSLLQRTGWARYRGEGRRTSCFFSSRRRDAIFDCDWSSDGCSSDLGALALGRGQAAGALLHLKKAAKLDPSSAKTHFALSRAYRRLGRNDEAAKEATLFDKLKE